MTGRPIYALRDYTLGPESARRIAVALEHEHMTTVTARALDTPPTAAGREAQSAVVDVLRDLLAQHGLEPVPYPGPGGEWCAVEEAPRGHALAVTVALVGDGGPVAALPAGAYIEHIGTEPTPEPEYVSVAGDALPRPAAALVTAWWEEVQAAGEVQLPAVEWEDLRPTRGGGLFSLLGPALYSLDTALEYAARLERAATELRGRVERARADDGTRDADYADALDRLAVVERAEGKYDADTTDHAVTRAADAIRTGRARVTSAADAGLAGEGWALATKPAPEPDGE